MRKMEYENEGIDYIKETSKNGNNDTRDEDEDTSEMGHKNKNKGYKQDRNENKRYNKKHKPRHEDLEEEFCSDATYLAREMASTERLSNLDLSKLFNLNVKLKHTVLPQHEIETRAGSHMPTREQIEKFESIATLKKGSYSLSEDHIIVDNWKVFCELHDWDVRHAKPFLQLRIGSMTNMRHITERRKFVQFLADGLPNRTLYSVYHRFRNLYEGNVTRRYKPVEDKMIIDHLENNPSLDEKRKYADLAKVLRRTRNSIWRRYRILKKRSKKLKDT